MKILTILGARPQFIKAGSVSRELSKYKQIKEIIVHTGQHYDVNMSTIFFDEMKLPKPDYFLGIGGKSHGAMTGQMLEKIEDIVLRESPDWILVYGDTNSTLAGALVASKLHIKLAHIEAGLRSFNMQMPEEINRIITDRISNVLFYPTDTALENLLNEGFGNYDCKLIKSGDVMHDGIIFYEKLAKKPDIKLNQKYILVTIHRAENTNDTIKLKQLIEILNEINNDVQVVLPIHPRTKKIIKDNSIDVKFTMINPVGYLNMIWLIKNSKFIMTDSGGLQKESYFLHKPCIVLRDETEWVELVENNFNILTGVSRKKIINAISNIDDVNRDYGMNFYGNGTASETIVKELLK